MGLLYCMLNSLNKISVRIGRSSVIPEVQPADWFDWIHYQEDHSSLCKKTNKDESS
jgi:hypothetical protein